MDLHRDLALLAAWRLRVPIRALRSLARGDHDALRRWLAAESATRLAEARRDARLDFAALERLDARLITPLDAEWPAAFDELPDPPAFIAVRGMLPVGGVAVIGARDADEPMREFARAFAARLGVPIVSGLARGIDTAAHRGALDAARPTIAYVGTGLALTSPAENQALAEEIVACGGAVVAERPPFDRATRWSLVRRDRLQAAHAQAVVLVASDAAGGAMHTMRFARELNRPRFALDIPASGNQQALEQGAVPLPYDVEAAATRVTLTE